MELQMDNCAIRPRQSALRLLICVCPIVLLLSGNPLWAADATPVQKAQLQSKPNRCIALHQGQVCYQNIVLSWQVDQASEYCLYQQQAEQPLHCWQAVSSGQYFYAFASDSSVKLQLVHVQTKAVVAETLVEVAWVYKANTRRKTHWRLF
jgi:hypothetical protein